MGSRIVTVLLAALLLAALPAAGCEPAAPVVTGSDEVLATAYEDRHSGLQVTGSGTVARILADDSDGGRHQRFILELDSGQTLLIAHNIDVAPRIPTLAVGDRVQFNGVYEWNDEGGAIHWTHHDPAGVHVTGWLEHNGTVYQ